MLNYRIHCHCIETWHWKKGGDPINHMMYLSLLCACEKQCCALLGITLLFFLKVLRTQLVFKTCLSDLTGKAGLLLHSTIISIISVG